MKTVLTFQRLKDSGEKISMLTAYDYSTAQILDKAEIDGYAVAAVTVLSKAGIINGSNGNFNPKNYCTRAEMAKIVYGVISNIGEEATK